MGSDVFTFERTFGYVPVPWPPRANPNVVTLAPGEIVVSATAHSEVVAERNLLRTTVASLRETIERHEELTRRANAEHETQLAVQRNRIATLVAANGLQCDIIDSQIYTVERMVDRAAASEARARDAESQSTAEAINGLCERVHELAVEKGWYESDRQVPELVALIHSEASEVLEAYRDTKPGDNLSIMKFGANGKPEGIPAELADIVIRTCDMAAHLGIKLGDAIKVKHSYNCNRERRHGGKRC